jgi:Protein of Unknown function (DUF2784)
MGGVTVLAGALAGLVAVVHLCAVAFVLVGGLLAWRWPGLVAAHVPVFLAVAGVNLAGLDCPLTVLEKHLRALGGEQPYAGGFIEHYLVQPFYPPGLPPGGSTALLVVALVPNLLAYGVLSTVSFARRSPLARTTGRWTAARTAATEPTIRTADSARVSAV